MVKAACIALLFVATRVAGQIPTSSPALDPDFVVLQPKETFAGRYANQNVGSVIHTVAPLRWDVPQGAVFLRNVDTAGYTPLEIEDKMPGGPFLQHQTFSLFDKALFRINGLRDPSILFINGKTQDPVMAAQAGSLFFFFSDGNGKFIDTTYYHAYTPKTFIYGNSFRYSGGEFNNDSLDDFIGIERSGETPNDSTVIGIWYSYDIVYKGDTSQGGKRLIPSSEEFVVHPKFYKDLEMDDFDKDGVTDIAYLAGQRNERMYLVIHFGMLNNGHWSIDSTDVFEDSALRSIKFMDFLHEDGIQDLLIGTDDTIYCFSGHKPKFLRSGFSLDDADFKIPSPAQLDPKNFNGNGVGRLWDWGEFMFNLGNVNGSNAHCLAVLTDYSPDTNGFDVSTYCFIYSGGKAADEHIDAVFADNSSHYIGFRNADSVRVGPGETNFLLGDPFYTAGSVGRIFYIEGRADIPHKPNPQWSVIRSSTDRNNISIECNQVAHNTSLQVYIHTLTLNAGTLILRDILGRTIREVTVPNAGTYERVITLPIDGITNGSYVLQYIENTRSATKQIFIIH